MKKGYLIAVDLDGTLIRNFDDYDKKSFDLLKKLSKENYIVIATGRPYRSSKYYYDILELNTPIINYNGALVQHPSDSNFKKSMLTIDRQIVIDFIKDNEDILINLFCEVEDDIYLMNRTDEVIPYLHPDGGNLIIGSLDETLLQNPNGAIVIAEAGSKERLKKYIKDKYNNINIRFWGVEGILIGEIYNPFVNKGTALKDIADYYNIEDDKIIAIGDGPNDVEMITMAHIGVTMRDCYPELLTIANEVTETVEEHGVYLFLKKFFEINEKD